MGDTLLHTYTPLLFWTTIGAILLRFTPPQLPRFLARVLFWVGVPLEIFALARQTNFSETVAIVPLSLAFSIGTTLCFAGLAWRVLDNRHRSQTPTIETLTAHSQQDLHDYIQQHLHDRRRQGSFILGSILGNTGFIGLAVLPLLVTEEHLGAAIVYSVANNLFVTYGVGVVVASYFGRSVALPEVSAPIDAEAVPTHPPNPTWGWQQVRDLLTVPSLWAFILGSSTQSIDLPNAWESALDQSIWVVIPCAFVLMGMRIGQLHGWESLRLALIPSLLKIGVMPLVLGWGLSAIGITGDLRLALVLMAGMPTAFAGLILTEEYQVDTPLIASCILISSIGFLATLPLWLTLFA